MGAIKGGNNNTGLIVLLIASVLGALSYIGWQVKVLLGVLYSFSAYKLTGFFNGDGSRATNPFNAKYLGIDISMLITNSSVFSVKILSYDFMIYLNDVYVAKLSDSVAQTINGNSKITITFPLKLDVSELWKSAISNNVLTYISANQYDKIILKFAGSVTGSLLGISVKKPVVISMTLKEIQDIYNAP